MPVLALAVLTGLQGADAARRVIVVLPLTWLIAGVLAGALAGSSSPVPDWLLLGALLLIDRALSPRVLTAIAVGLGLLLGAANGTWRVAGSWLAASGLLLLGWSLR
ncbi:MAG TPA: hypothetical protein PLO14_13685 [Accumulibacter sp.]|uniref:hypothetical protein n=1 Tax=Accumulibacter sp. TaxID=2053492 RepID=UPI0025D721D3|nr:hypothetical protein [Accumulibacter sp.]MCM8663619.1 hypothetical protein [Accumulibacter sp.]HMW82031.1 hypothetical protein [Accumulibacter sp.]HNC53266.1 hypothetical protein [Accumulibacter sp.]